MSETISLGIKEILSILPHRYPFLLVDRVDELVPSDHIRAYKNLTFNEPFFQGHFPEVPVMPGVLIIEAMGPRPGSSSWRTVFLNSRNIPTRFTCLPA